MSIVSSVQRLPEELRFPLLEFAEAIEQNMRAELAVRREDLAALQAVTQSLVEGQLRAEQRLDRLETVVIELAEAQTYRAARRGTGRSAETYRGTRGPT
jgi:hypothetical protein